MSGDRGDEGEGLVVRLPQIGESMRGGIVVRVLHPVGSRVRKDEALFEVDLDKVCVEVVAPIDGVVASIAVRLEQEVVLDEALCVLRADDGRAVAMPSRPYPSVTATRLRWDTRRERGDGRAGETALLLVALARALAAVPTLLGRPWPLHCVCCDLERGRARWVHAALAPDLDVAAARALVRAGEAGPREDWPMHVHVLRVGAPGTGPTRTAACARQLCVDVGPVRDEAIVVDGKLVIRPIAEIELTLGTAVPADDLVVFAAALVEQLAAV